MLLTRFKNIKQQIVGKLPHSFVVPAIHS